MGLSMIDRQKECEGPGSGDLRRARFGEYFPRLFAYIRPWVATDAQANGVVVETFTRIFAYRTELDDAQFPIVLFGLARDLCREGKSAARGTESGLNAREREVIALLFDARLKRSDVGCLLGIGEQAVTSTLLRGLRKLQANSPSPVTSASPRS